MEIFVTDPADVLEQLLHTWDGGLEPPVALENFIASNQEILDVDPLLVAAVADFGDVPKLLQHGSYLDPDEKLRLARRIGWIVRVLADWNPAGDGRGVRLQAALAGAASVSTGDSFWRAVQTRINSRLTMAGLEVVVRGRAVNATILEDAPVWEREHLEALQRADQAADWSKLVTLTQAFRLPRIDPPALMAARGLALLDRLRLVKVADSKADWMDAASLLSALSLADAVRVATASRSEHIRFAVLERIVYREKRPLSPTEEGALRNLFLVLSKDRNSWSAWLDVCNRYPVRQPYIQSALARALTRCDEQAIVAYVDSISLSVSGTDGRKVVTACLSEFRRRSTPARRTILWRRAFNRWEHWNFGSTEGQGLSSIAVSELDYAVMGSLIEAPPSNLVANPGKEFDKCFQELEAEWHPELSAAMTGFIRLMSRYQLRAHALTVNAAASNWLPASGSSLYVPPKIDNDFVRRRYQIPVAS